MCLVGDLPIKIGKVLSHSSVIKRRGLRQRVIHQANYDGLIVKFPKNFIWKKIACLEAIFHNWHRVVYPWSLPHPLNIPKLQNCLTVLKIMMMIMIGRIVVKAQGVILRRERRPLLIRQGVKFGTNDGWLNWSLLSLGKSVLRYLLMQKDDGYFAASFYVNVENYKNICSFNLIASRQYFLNFFFNFFETLMRISPGVIKWVKSLPNVKFYVKILW